MKESEYLKERSHSKRFDIPFSFYSTLFSSKDFSSAALSRAEVTAFRRDATNIKVGCNTPEGEY